MPEELVGWELLGFSCLNHSHRNYFSQTSTVLYSLFPWCTIQVVYCTNAVKKTFVRYCTVLVNRVVCIMAFLVCTTRFRAFVKSGAFFVLKASPVHCLIKIRKQAHDTQPPNPVINLINISSHFVANPFRALSSFIRQQQQKFEKQNQS